jgi:hypothetical protein
MFELDCSSGDEALRSLALGFRCTPPKLKEVLYSLDLDDLYQDIHSAPRVSIGQFLYRYVVGKLGHHLELSSVVWFHCTRTSPDNEFSDGISPLNDSSHKVWQILLDLAPERTVREKLRAMKEKGVNDDLYALRTQNSIHWGPYGILVRDVAFVAEDLSQHDYLKIPELIEDICNAYQLDHGVSLHEHYSKVLKPIMVKFKSRYRVDFGCIESALGYAYRYIRDHKPDDMSITCIDCQGVAVSADQIVAVEYVEP